MWCLASRWWRPLDRNNVKLNGTFAYGGDPVVDALFRKQAHATDTTRRGQLLEQFQRLLHERIRFAPIFEYVWPSAVGPRVADPI